MLLCWVVVHPVFSQSRYEKDFSEFCHLMEQHYAYLDQQGIHIERLKQTYQSRIREVSSDQEFIAFMETVLHEFHNGHLSLNTNLPSSNRLVPSGTDLCVERRNGKFFIVDIRRGFGAELCGLKIGMEVVAFNDKPVEAQLQQFLPNTADSLNENMYRYALDMLFAGTHDQKREITVLEQGKQKTFSPITYRNRDELLYVSVINPKTACIRINNSLGNLDLIPAFDKALDSLAHYPTLVLDLTETPSGGNTTVARAILGRFTKERLPYQRHEFTETPYQTLRHWVEYVSPRAPVYNGNLFVLAGRWTGSMGEGMVIGLDAMQRGKIIGTPMAGLLGAIYSFQLPETKISVQFPSERLYHVNGSPREEYVPQMRTSDSEQTMKKLAEEVRL